ncbi:hypothetical protein [Micromonospora globispora]|uniref:hypothetical protein n=1 Tax=Micromonospora globispora TaxID=1450148 RepID=UPI001FB01357|nr:hypothetical protein [Micromonospora globispora]
MAGSEGWPDEEAEGEQRRSGAEDTATPTARRGTAWVILGVVAAALVICCCSAVIGLAVSWSAGLFGNR